MPALVDPARAFVLTQHSMQMVTTNGDTFLKQYVCDCQMSFALPVTDAAGAPFFGDLLGLLLPGNKARGTRICKHRNHWCQKASPSREYLLQSVILTFTGASNFLGVPILWLLETY